MSRTIKFRIRDSNGKLLGYERFVAHHWECITVQGLAEAGPDDWLAGTLAGDVREEWTGIDDKKGVDIYEQDIVSNGMHRDKVMYDSRLCSFVLPAWPLNATWGKSPRSGIQLVNIINIDGTCDLEVIGNTSDDPELLAQKALQ